MQKWLNMLPNLEALELLGISSSNEENEPIEWEIKSTKIERIKMFTDGEILNLLNALDKCAIKEATLDYWTESEAEIVNRFLKVHEKSLKKLTIYSTMDISRDLKGLQLEFLSFSYHDSPGWFELLEHQKELKVLKINLLEVFNDSIVNTICGLKSLETLKLDGSKRLWIELKSLRNLRYLENLKRLEIDGCLSRNILDHLRLGIFNNLEDLDASIQGASLDSIIDMKFVTPNLRKIKLWTDSSDTIINALLHTLEHLESMEIYSCKYWAWKIPSYKIHPKIKYLKLCFVYDDQFNAEQFTKIFPNLESLDIAFQPRNFTESFLVTFLSGMKQLKVLLLGTSEVCFGIEFALQCIRDYGENLETFKLYRSPHEEPRIGRLTNLVPETEETAIIVPGFKYWEFLGRIVCIKRLQKNY
jgi:hypothetical protein